MRSVPRRSACLHTEIPAFICGSNASSFGSDPRGYNRITWNRHACPSTSCRAKARYPRLASAGLANDDGCRAFARHDGTVYNPVPVEAIISPRILMTGTPNERIHIFRARGQDEPSGIPGLGGAAIRRPVRARNGVVVAMAPERAGHNRRKALVWQILRQAVQAAGLPCEVLHLTDQCSLRLGTDATTRNPMPFRMNLFAAQVVR